MLLYFIIACEVGFWLFLFVGLLVRYGFKRPTASNALLLCVPALDVALLTATATDLSRGNPAEFAHGLAAVYLGFTIVYGHSIIGWVDQYVAHRFAKGPKPYQSNLYGWDHTRYEWQQWLRAVLACAIAGALLAAAMLYVGNDQDVSGLKVWFDYMFWLLVIWLVGWPLWYTLFPKKEAPEQ